MSDELNRPRIMIGHRDVTEQVADMFDAIVGSLDWGSAMLGTDEVMSILYIAKLMGWDTPSPNNEIESIKMSDIGRASMDSAVRLKTYKDFKEAKDKHWQKQVEAMLSAKDTDLQSQYENLEQISLALAGKALEIKKKIDNE